MNTIFNRNLAQKKIFVEREFAAPVPQVWKAWTTSELLDRWWAPEPYKAVTKSMDFRNGGYWLYYMLGPDGSKMYARADFSSIIQEQSYHAVDAFCDESGVINTDFPRMNWKVRFSRSAVGTKVDIEIAFASEADLLKIAEMGFQEGFTMAHGNLDRLLAK